MKSWQVLVTPSLLANLWQQVKIRRLRQVHIYHIAAALWPDHYVYACAQTLYSHSSLCMLEVTLCVRMLRYNFVFSPQLQLYSISSSFWQCLGSHVQLLYTASTRKQGGEPKLVDMSSVVTKSYFHTNVAYPANYDTYYNNIILVWNT